MQHFTLNNYKKWATSLFWAALFFTTILMFIPGSPPKNTGFMHWDKVQHALVFLLLIKLAWSAYPHQKWLVALGLIVFGAAIEILQSALTTTRIGSTGDWLADIVGIMLGISFCMFAFNQPLKTN